MLKTKYIKPKYKYLIIWIGIIIICIVWISDTFIELLLFENYTFFSRLFPFSDTHELITRLFYSVSIMSFSIAIQFLINSLINRNNKLYRKEQLLKKISENYPHSYLSIIEKDFTIGYTAGEEFKKQHLDPKQFIGFTLEEIFKEKTPIVREYYERTFKGEEHKFELFINNQYQNYHTTPFYSKDGTISQILVVVENIHEQKLDELQNNFNLSILENINKIIDVKELMVYILNTIKEYAKCDAVGIRLREGDDFPYFVTDGFSNEFVIKEKYLCQRDLNGQLVRDEIGTPVIECMCGNVICGRFDSTKSFFTEYGSFIENNTTKLLASTTPKERLARTRNRCNADGYESVLLVPLKYGGETFGLIQCNDFSINHFSDRFVKNMENIANYLSIALSHRKNIELLKKNEKNLKESQKIAQLGSWYIDLKTNEVEWTEELYEMFGFDSKFPPPSYNEFIKLFKLDSWNKLSIVLDKTKETVTPYELELETVKEDGTNGWIWFYAEAVTDENNNIVGIWGAAQDITKKKHIELELLAAKEKAEEANQLKTEFIHNISHEIRTPLNWIQGYAQILSAETTDYSLKESIDYIFEGSERLKILINDMLEIATIESGKLSFEQEIVNLNNLIKSTCKQFKLDLIKKNINLYIDIDDDFHSNIITDAKKLDHIIMNLVGNSVKFSKRGTIGIFVSKIDNSFFKITIEDDGVGISDDLLDYIYKPFFQGSNLGNLALKGIGLGLAIVKKHIDFLGGEINIDSTVNEGTTISFTYPYKQVNIEKKLKAIIDEEVEKIKLDGMKILIVEDDEINSAICSKILTKRGASCISCYTGMEALEIYDKDIFHAIIMDIKLPDISGLLVTELIRRKYSSNKLPILAYTALASKLDREKCINAGCNDYISKPFNVNDFIKKLKKYI